MTIPQEQTDAKVRNKQQWIRRQVKAGKLVVRQMTPDERAKFPPLPAIGRKKNTES